MFSVFSFANLVLETCKRAVSYCSEQGESIEKYAIQYSVANEDIATTLVGTADLEQAENNVKWAEEYWNDGMKRKDVYDEVVKIMKPVHNQVWNQGLPENDD